MKEHRKPASPQTVTGRGARIQPDNRFERLQLEVDMEQFDDDPSLASPRKINTQFFDDASQSIIAENNSPDVGFRWSMNPYRGCEHGCAYCYARPGHEYLGMSAGIDFETKILVKRNAPQLLREALNRSSWQGDVIVLSGVTDCYQPAERQFGITRRLLEVLAEARNPCGIITKNALVVRDLDVLREMARDNLVHVNISITTLDPELSRSMEPRTSQPEARLRAVRELSAAGIPVRVMIAPLVPGLTDSEVPRILQAASEAGANSAAYVLLRLPLAVEPVFDDWLFRERPLQRDRILALVRSMRQGRLNDSQWGRRMVGEGAYAQHVKDSFRIFLKRFGLDRELPAYNTTLFRPPSIAGAQLRLF